MGKGAVGLAEGAGLLLLLAASPTGHAAPESVLAIVAPDYSDTSDEPEDQTAAHAARRASFLEGLRADLSRGYRVVTVACDQSPCPPATLIARGRDAGARLLLYGGIHKMSTLIQNGKFEVVNLATSELVFDRLITFRGDTDEAWRRAEHFLAGELLAQHPQ